MMENLKKNTESKHASGIKNLLKGFALPFLYKYFNLLLALVVLIVLVLGYFLLLKPKYKSIQESSKTINNERLSKKDQLISLSERIVKYKKSYGLINEIDKQKIHALLPKGPEIEDLFVQLEDMVKKRGLVLVDLKVTDADSPENSIAVNPRNRGEAAKQSQVSKIGIVKIALSVKGIDYASLMGFLEVIENNLRLIDVKSLNFSPSNNTVSLSLDTYYLK